jgi:succinate-acetate transporter protein
MTVTFSTLFVGFILLDLVHFGFPELETLAAIILIICAFSAWYMLAAIVLNDVSGRELLKMGKPFIKGE